MIEVTFVSIEPIRLLKNGIQPFEKVVETPTNPDGVHTFSDAKIVIGPAKDTAYLIGSISDLE